MSSAFALAAVTAVIKYQIDNGFPQSLHERISLLPPDRLNNGDANQNRINLFLYMVTQNSGWHNIDLPSHNSEGARIANPKLALDLHYLLTASGSGDYQSEILLGNAMQILHNSPVLRRDKIKKALDNLPQDTLNRNEIIISKMEEQVEQIKITQQNLNIEEISKLWSSFQTNYRLTVSYLATVVLIESNLSMKSSLPVTNRNVYVFPFNNPVIKKIFSSKGANSFITTGSEVVTKGENFPVDNMGLLISEVDFTENIASKSKTEIIFTFPDPIPEKIFSGIQLAKIVSPIYMGTPPTEHTGIESNIEAFILHPEITASLGNSADTVVNNIHVKNGKIKIEFNPNINKNQKITLFLNEFDPPEDRSPHSYSFAAPNKNGIVEPNTVSKEVTFEFTNVIAGKYLVRVRVDGADSLLVQEEDENNPNFNKFIKPSIEIQ